MLKSGYVKLYMPLLIIVGGMLVITGFLMMIEPHGHDVPTPVLAGVLTLTLALDLALLAMRRSALSRAVLAVLAIVLILSSFTVGALGPGPWRATSVATCVVLLVLVTGCTVVRADDIAPTRAPRVQERQ